MKNVILMLMALIATVSFSELSAQNSKKVWVEPGKGAFYHIPKDLKGIESKETTTETKEFSDEKGSGKFIARVNPDGKIVSIKFIPEQRMLVDLNYNPSAQEGYISDCCEMCRRLGGGFLCCCWCTIEH